MEPYIGVHEPSAQPISATRNNDAIRLFSVGVSDGGISNPSHLGDVWLKTQPVQIYGCQALRSGLEYLELQTLSRRKEYCWKPSPKILYGLVNWKTVMFQFLYPIEKEKNQLTTFLKANVTRKAFLAIV